MTNCTALTTHNRTPPFITKTNLFELIPNTYAVHPGTHVTVKCAPSLNLVGDQTLKCLENGQWNYSTKPYCNALETDDDKPWYNSFEDLILVGVIWGLAAILVLAVVITIVTLIIRKNRERKHDDSHSHHGVRYSYHGHRHRHDTGYESRHGISNGEPREHHHRHRHEHGDGRVNHEEFNENTHVRHAEAHEDVLHEEGHSHFHHRQRHDQSHHREGYLHHKEEHHHRSGHNHHRHEHSAQGDRQSHMHHNVKHGHHGIEHETHGEINHIPDDESVPGFDFQLEHISSYKF